jgi:nicotinamide mononucleotide (NMN) deamidase PncC
MKDKTKSQTKTVMALLEWADTYLACMENCTSGGIGDDITELRQQIEEVLDYDPRGIKQDIFHD